MFLSLIQVDTCSTMDQVKQENSKEQSLSIFLDFFTSKIKECKDTGLSNFEAYKIILSLWDTEKNNWILKKSIQNKQKIYIRKQSSLSDFEIFLIDELKKRTESINNDDINIYLLKEKWEDMKRHELSRKHDNKIVVNESRQFDIPILPPDLDINVENQNTNSNGATTTFIPPTNLNSPKPPNRFECNICKKEFDSRAKLKYHEKKMHAENINSCHICSQNFTSLSNLRRHVRNVHKIKNLKSSCLKSKDRFWCKQCSYKGRDNHDLQNHQRKHTGERPFSCEKCTFSFRKKSDLNKHKQAYCKGTKNKCGKCEKNFFSRKQYYKHCLWSESCGSMSSAAPAPKTGNSGEEESPEIVRFNVGKDASLVGVNCEDLIKINLDYFSKRSKKSRCGVCLGCCTDQDCGSCRGCLLKQRYEKLAKSDSEESHEELVTVMGTKRGRSFLCERRQCLKTVVQYDVRKSVRSELVRSNFVKEPTTSLLKTDTIFEQYSHLPVLDETSVMVRDSQSASQLSSMIPLVEDAGTILDIFSDKVEVQELFVLDEDTEVVREEVVLVEEFDSTSMNHEGVTVCSNDVVFHDDVTMDEDETKYFHGVIVMNEEVVQS